MKNRFWKMALSLLMVLGVLTACSSSSSESSSSTAEETSASTSEETSERKVYRVGMECAYAPNNWQEDEASDTNLPIDNLEGFYAEGYDVQIAKLIGEYLDADIVVVKLAWEGLIEALNQGQIDMIIAGMADTPERRETINFSDTYNVEKTKYCLLVRSDSQYVNATSLADFEGASVLGQKGTRYDEVIDQIENVNHLPGVDSTASMLSRLEEGTADAIVIGTTTAATYEEANDAFKAVYFEEGKGFTLDFQGSCVGLRLEDTDLLEQVNAALATISTETRQQLLDTANANMPK